MTTTRFFFGSYYTYLPNHAQVVLGMSCKQGKMHRGPGQKRSKLMLNITLQIVGLYILFNIHENLNAQYLRAIPWPTLVCNKTEVCNSAMPHNPYIEQRPTDESGVSTTFHSNCSRSHSISVRVRSLA